MDVSNVVIGGVTRGSKCALGFNIDSCFQLIVSLILQFFSLEIIIYQVDPFRQTHRNTGAHFTCPLDHLYFYLPKIKISLNLPVRPGFFPALIMSLKVAQTIWKVYLVASYTITTSRGHIFSLNTLLILFFFLGGGGGVK